MKYNNNCLDAWRFKLSSLDRLSIWVRADMRCGIIYRGRILWQ